ncbi:recombinase family protein [Sphingomonas sp. SRS2]|uniref:recombinase family protein n=1 Tax=Sphingomonas sp. SRS2 TaxID=133190 RepID=UPI000618437D|nr:recombinase family protein [Sphingomonas sp. SRS2]KKC27276.1 hypothetical protein WP12_04135 [Sphingomonas sp. SRS2]
MGTGMLVKAAQYVRMSTDKQIYSTVNQMASIGSYAMAHGFEIVRTYADEGRSGLRIKGRAALQEMLRDVLSGEPGYQAILVFDVSRWGRFQDTDESAHYEFLCRSSGVQVHYCAEGFDNDGSLASAIVKNLRRAMAGEYSRDLSAKVWAAQCRLVSMGYKMGGVAGYGLARLLVDQTGRPKQILARGEHKSIASDRVLLIPGEAAEVATVRRIFRLASRGKSNRAIAETLNQDGIPGPVIDRWDQNTVRQMLKAERYVGSYVYNKRSAKLGAGYVFNPQAAWVKREKAFQPIVSAQLFSKVQRMKRGAAAGYSDDALKNHLRSLAAKHGHLSSEIIDAAPGPASKTYSYRFGSLAKAYAAVGYDPANAERPTDARAIFAKNVVDLLRNQEIAVSVAPTQQLTIEGRYVLAPSVCRVRRIGQRDYWAIKQPRSAGIDFVIAAFMRGACRDAVYLVPISRFGKSRKIEISAGSNQMSDYEVWNFEFLVDMIRWHGRERRPVSLSAPPDR